jgi:hypothetical protein
MVIRPCLMPVAQTPRIGFDLSLANGAIRLGRAVCRFHSPAAASVGGGAITFGHCITARFERWWQV